MPTPKTKAADPGSEGDLGAAEVQAKFDEAADKGYFGEVPPGPPNEAYSLESGPDSPNALEEAEAVAKTTSK